jgi:3-oxoacyl-[acyl-carrier-protein] synthase II
LKGAVLENATPGSNVPSKGVLWNPDEWLSGADQRRMARYTQYAVAAADMALADAGWNPEAGSIAAQDTGVCLGSGIGNFDDIYDTCLTYHAEVCPAAFFVLFLFGYTALLCLY